MGDIDAIVAGAGIWGCTVARRLAEAGRKVLVLEKRAAVGGNCRCEIDPETGIEIHTYGSHIFHTSIPEVWEFVNRFTTFNDYRHVVIAKHNGKLYHLPIGKTLYREFGTDDKQAIFDAFIKNYTAKQSRTIRLTIRNLPRYSSGIRMRRRRFRIWLSEAVLAVTGTTIWIGQWRRRWSCQLTNDTESENCAEYRGDIRQIAAFGYFRCAPIRVCAGDRAVLRTVGAEKV